MEKANLIDARAADMLRKFLPTCSMNDRASTARAAARKVLGLPDGDDDPTCAEHGLVNILEEGRKAMDKVLREMMAITDAQAEGDAAKIKAMRTCVGWFSSPACALIYQVGTAAPRHGHAASRPLPHVTFFAPLTVAACLACATGRQVRCPRLVEGLRHRPQVPRVD